MRKLSLLVALLAGAASAAVPFKNGVRFALDDVPGELVVERRAGEPVRFALEENGTTGYLWTAEWNTNECEVVLDHRGAAEKNERGEMLCGAAGTLNVAVTSKIYTPARIEFAYKRSWEKGVKPIRALKLIVYTVDRHSHIRGGMTPEMALQREQDSGIRSTAMENHGRAWESYDDAKLSFGTNNFDRLDLKASDIWTK